jgi:flagellar protein FliO/FliZ
MDFGGYLQFILALVFVLGLIGILALLLRRYGTGAIGAFQLRKGQKKRLSIVEVAAVDTKRRLVLVRRDDREHLILLGANSELLIESGITRNQRQREIEC